MEELIIQVASKEDFQAIKQNITIAKATMNAIGNKTQWASNYPSEQVIYEDIDHKYAYICKDMQGEVVASFSFIPGPDSTYASIQGKWLNHKPYYTLHRMASNGKRRGVAKVIFNWCLQQQPNLRIDTHKDNHIMIHLIEKFGFTYCGIIQVDDGTDRNAYQKTRGNI